MPFGKYKGHEVDSLPREYLRWLTENCALREPLATAVEDALDAGALARSSPLPAELKPTVREIISVGFRMLAMKLHPDLGGDHRQMVKLNAAREWLEDRTN